MHSISDSLWNFHLEVLYEYKIIDVVPKKDISLRTVIKREEIVEEIIKNDNIKIRNLLLSKGGVN